MTPTSGNVGLDQAFHEWLDAFHAMEKRLAVGAEASRHDLASARLSYERQGVLLEQLSGLQDWKGLVPPQFHDQLEEELERFVHLPRQEDGRLCAAVVLPFALWNDAPSSPGQPASGAESIVSLWEEIRNHFDTITARILREGRLQADQLLGSLDVALLPPLGLEAVDGNLGWPPGSLSEWSEEEVFARSPANDGDWLRAGLVVVRIQAPDYAALMWAEKVVVDEWQSLAMSLATPRRSVGLSPDLADARLMAHYLRWELLARQVGAIVRSLPPLCEASTLLVVERDVQGNPMAINAITRLPGVFSQEDGDDQDGEQQIPGYCEVDGEEGLAAALAPWLANHHPGYLIHVEQHVSEPASSIEVESPWMSAPPSTRLH